MSNASLIYESLTNYAAIAALIGKQEDIFLDFKESRSSTGALLDDDRAHFSKAASGFAHQEGGVLVWGVEARRGTNEIDEAKALRPITNIKKFLAGLNDYVKYSTEPVVDGILSRAIFENDNPHSGKGYAATFFPKSESEHRALGNNRSDFYKRHGDSFSPLSTADIRALFFRNLSPDLELQVTSRSAGRFNFSLRNIGKGIAKFPSAHIRVFPNAGGRWLDGEGSREFKIGPVIRLAQNPYELQFIANANVVVHPDQEICILVGPVIHAPQPPPRITRVDYRLFAENMVPKEGSTEL